jgi:excisionase family DNA binding protein
MFGAYHSTSERGAYAEREYEAAFELPSPCLESAKTGRIPLVWLTARSADHCHSRCDMFNALLGGVRTPRWMSPRPALRLTVLTPPALALDGHSSRMARGGALCHLSTPWVISFSREASCMRVRHIESESTLLSAGDVATLLRTSRKAIYALVERKQLPGVIRFGRRLLVDRKVLLDWLRQKSTPSLRE